MVNEAPAGRGGVESKALVPEFGTETLRCNVCAADEQLRTVATTLIGELPLPSWWLPPTVVASGTQAGGLPPPPPPPPPPAPPWAPATDATARPAKIDKVARTAVGRRMMRSPDSEVVARRTFSPATSRRQDDFGPKTPALGSREAARPRSRQARHSPDAGLVVRLMSH